MNTGARDIETYGHFTVNHKTKQLLSIDTTTIKGFIIDPVAFAYDFGARMYDARVGHFVSIDPLASQFPNQSPYSAFNNNPNIFVDPTGRSNIIYLVVLPDANAKMGKLSAQDIANQANANFKSLGLETRVVVVQHSAPMTPSFDPKNMDATDAMAVLGGSKQATENYIKGAAPDVWQYKYRGWGKSTALNPEKSVIGGNVIALDASDFYDWADKHKNLSFLETVALIINHGTGHNAGNSIEHEHEGRVNNNFHTILKTMLQL